MEAVTLSEWQYSQIVLEMPENMKILQDFS